MSPVHYLFPLSPREFHLQIICMPLHCRTHRLIKVLLAALAAPLQPPPLPPFQSALIHTPQAAYQGQEAPP